MICNGIILKKLGPNKTSMVLCNHSDAKMKLPGTIKKLVIKMQSSVFKKVEKYIEKAKKNGTFPKEIIRKHIKIN